MQTRSEQSAHGRTVSLRLDNGEEIGAHAVYSSADPRHTLLTLVGARELPPEFAWQAQSIKLRGSVGKVHVETDGRHGLPDGTIVVAPAIRYLERAYDAAKYGEFSAEPYMDVAIPSIADPSLAPAGAHVMSVYAQFAPFALREGD